VHCYNTLDVLLKLVQLCWGQAHYIRHLQRQQVLASRWQNQGLRGKVMSALG
jgi:hypothetical protein